MPIKTVVCFLKILTVSASMLTILNTGVVRAENDPRRLETERRRSITKAVTENMSEEKIVDDTQLSLQERVFIASKMYAITGTFFAHFQAIPDFDLDAAYKTFLEIAFSPKTTRYEFDFACMEFVAQLKNGHSGFIDPWLYDKYGQSMGFRAQYVEGHWVVTRSERPDLKVGDVLDTIDGKSVEAIFQEKKRYISASNEWATRRSFFNRNFLFPQQYTLKLADGRQVAITRHDTKVMEEETSGKWLRENQVAYIKIPGFHAAKFEQDALKLLETYKNASTLIIDLRGNGGGSTPGQLIDALMDRPYRSQAMASPFNVSVWKVRAAYFDMLDKDPKTPHDETYGYLSALKEISNNTMFYQPALPQKPQKPLFKGKLLVLIDRAVASAAEDFSIPFKDNHRALFIGETSTGSTGQPYYYEFPNKIAFYVSAKRDSFPDGSTFEGVGIAPDVEVPTTINHLRSGTDSVLAKALELAK